MENEWKELDISDLPSDILTGCYEFQEKVWQIDVYSLCRSLKWVKSTSSPHQILYSCDAATYRYRESEPKAPTHEEIMTKWWKIEDLAKLDIEISWYKCTGFKNTDGYLEYQIYIEHGAGDWASRSWFINRESADIPPEEK